MSNEEQYNQFDSFDCRWSEAYQPQQRPTMKQNFRNWMIDTAGILFDDSKNDLRALPKTVRLNILLVLSTVWSTAFSIWVFTSVNAMVYGWAGLVLGHIAIIMAMYFTFKQFHNLEKRYPYRWNSYHSTGRARSGMIGIDGTRVKFDPNDPGGEHE